MPLQDLTPQLRTRLSRLERAVGVFVILATLLLLTGFAYYVYHTAQRKGWLVTKVEYYTLMQSAAGLKEGDPVKLMGFDAGEITYITPNDPYAYYNVTIGFIIKEPYYGYLWADSMVKVSSGGILGSRFLEITKGGSSGTTNKADLSPTYLGTKHNLKILVKKGDPATYSPFSSFAGKPKAYWLPADESPSLTEQLARLVTQVEQALPSYLSLTNQINRAMTNSIGLVANLNQTVSHTQPILTNFAAIAEQLKNPNGSLGQWLIPTPINLQIQSTMSNVNSTVQTSENQINNLANTLNRSLENIAEATSNLNAQVQANSLILSEISSLIVNADDLLQGLKRNWLLKSSFQQPPPKKLESEINPSVGGSK